MHDHEKTLRGFISRWAVSFEGLLQAFGEFLADNVVWEKPSVSATYSAREAIDLLTSFKQNFDVATYESTIRQIIVRGDTAVVERVDHVRRSDGSLIVSLPAMGVFEFNADGRIAVWRDYFDSATVAKALAREG
jgi:limonene-1,2-epoxide hydrolase